MKNVSFAKEISHWLLHLQSYWFHWKFQVWEDVSMDFIEGLPKSLRYEVILVVVDRYAHFLSLKRPFNAEGVAELFVQE